MQKHSTMRSLLALMVADGPMQKIGTITPTKPDQVLEVHHPKATVSAELTLVVIQMSHIHDFWKCRFKGQCHRCSYTCRRNQGEWTQDAIHPLRCLLYGQCGDSLRTERCYQFFIASSSEIMQYGLPYKSLWNYINSSTPNYAGIISTSINFYNTTDYPYLNLAAIDCRELDGLASIMKEINSKYTLSENIDPENIQHLDAFSPNLFYDMEAYVDSLYPSGYLLDQFKNQLKLTVKAAGHTDYAYSFLYYKKHL